MNFPEDKLSRREREIMEIVYTEGKATAATIREAMQDPPGASSVRKLIQILENKGHLQHIKEGRQHVYLPVRETKTVARQSLQMLLDTFFGGSLRDAIATHLTGSSKKPSEAELREIARLISEARDKNGPDKSR